MGNLVTARKSLFKVKVEKGKTYSWCACALSKRNLSVMVAIEKRESLNLLNIIQKKAKTCIFVDVR